MKAVLGEAIPAETMARVVQLADGNAFYIEELLRRLAQGSSDLPETLLAMAQARLEQLPPSARRVIALKGYQSAYGRCLDALRAVEMCADALKDFRLTIYIASPDVRIAAELMSQRTGLAVEFFPDSSYEESLRMHARARVSLTVNISDGLPLSTVEAALMGAFPVQTNTSCVSERLEDGVGTLLVKPRR